MSLRAVSEKLPFTYTGADFYALCSDAMLKAVTRQASAVDAKIKALNESGHKQLTTASFFDHHATAEDIAVMVTEEDFMLAHKELIPSVSAGELAHYEKVRASFEGVKEEKAPVPAMAARRSVSGTSSRGKGRRTASGRDVKGKGKAVAYSDEEEDENDDGFRGVNGDKGKEVAVASPFGNGGASDDEDLYG